MGKGIQPEQYRTVADVIQFGVNMENAGGSPEDLAGVLMTEVASLNATKLESLKRQLPQYANALDQAINMGKGQGEVGVRARTLLTLLREDSPSVNLSALVTLVKKAKEQQ